MNAGCVAGMYGPWEFYFIQGSTPPSIDLLTVHMENRNNTYFQIDATPAGMGVTVVPGIYDETIQVNSTQIPVTIMPSLGKTSITMDRDIVHPVAVILGYNAAIPTTVWDVMIHEKGTVMFDAAWPAGCVATIEQLTMYRDTLQLAMAALNLDRTGMKVGSFTDVAVANGGSPTVAGGSGQDGLDAMDPYLLTGVGGVKGIFSLADLPTPTGAEDAQIIAKFDGTGALWVRKTWKGDANFDGMVDIRDLYILGVNWGQSGKTWFDADFTGDGIVNVLDLNFLSQNWQAGV